jgi:hypothetical protein
MQPIVKIVGPLAAADADGICLSQTPLAAGALTLDGALVTSGVAIINPPAKVTITTADDESGKTFTITGTDQSGNGISEVITGPDTTTGTSLLTYSTVTSIVVSAATADAITVGNAQSGASPWISLDPWAFPQVAIQCSVTGSVSYTVQQTLDNPNDPVSPVAAADVQWVDHPDANLVAASTTQQGNYGYAPLFMRVNINSGSGSVRMTVVQANVVSA